jgi:hypothetical protein
MKNALLAISLLASLPLLCEAAPEKSLHCGDQKFLDYYVTYELGKETTVAIEKRTFSRDVTYAETDNAENVTRHFSIGGKSYTDHANIFAAEVKAVPGGLELRLDDKPRTRVRIEKRGKKLIFSTSNEAALDQMASGILQAGERSIDCEI